MRSHVPEQLPLKQGLKQKLKVKLPQSKVVPEQLPLKQGLKPISEDDKNTIRGSSWATSIKTRIETGDITKIEFSSMSGLTNGYWDIGLTLKSSNGQSLSVSNKYTFKSGFDAITACNATADALTPAVQDLIKATVVHSEFSKLLK